MKGINAHCIVRMWEALYTVRHNLELFAQWLEALPPRAMRRLTKWINAYNRTYSFLLDGSQRREEDEDLPQALMKFFIILTKQVTAIVMAIRAVTGIHRAINGNGTTGGTQ